MGRPSASLTWVPILFYWSLRSTIHLAKHPFCSEWTTARASGRSACRRAFPKTQNASLLRSARNWNGPTPSRRRVVSLWYDKFFRAATGFEQPFGYRGRLACGDNVRLENPETLVQGRECLG